MGNILHSAMSFEDLENELEAKASESDTSQPQTEISSEETQISESEPKTE